MSLNIFSPLRKKQIIYTDFRKTLEINPISNDLAIKTNEDSVKEALKNLILTMKGEWLMQPNKGSDVLRFLFDNMTAPILKVLETNIIDTIKNYEPRINLLNVEVIPEYDNNKVAVNITYYIRNSEIPISVTIFLERSR